MAIRLLPNGIIEFDSAEEAVEYQSRIASSRVDNINSFAIPPLSLPQGLIPNLSSGSSELTLRIAAVFKKLDGHGLALMRSILESEKRIATAEISSQTGLEPGQIGPVMKAVRQVMESLSVQPEKIFRKLTFRTTDNRISTKYEATAIAKKTWTDMHN